MNTKPLKAIKNVKTVLKQDWTESIALSYRPEITLLIHEFYV